MEDELIQFGEQPHKLHRREAGETSVAAAHAVDTTDLEHLVYHDIKRFGVRGCIQDDILALHPGKAYSSITARFASLIRKRLIMETGEKRKGKSGRAQRVLRARHI